MSATANFGLVSSSMPNKLVRSPVLGAPRETTYCAFMTKRVESWEVDLPVCVCQWNFGIMQETKGYVPVEASIPEGTSNANVSASLPFAQHTS